MMKAWAVLALMVASACETHRVSQRAPGEPTMSELMHRRAAARGPADLLPVQPPRDPTADEILAASGLNATADVYARVIRYYTANGKPRAAATLDRAERARPHDTQWLQLRARLYYQTLVGSRGALPYGVVHTVNNDDANGRFALEIRRRLTESVDPRLLILVARELAVLGTQPSIQNGLNFDPLPLAASYARRARDIGAEKILLESVLDSIERAGEYRELLQLTRGRRPEDALAEATTAQKLVLMESIMNGASHRDERRKCVSTARSLLALTTQVPETPRVLQLRADAQLMLGKMALRDGDPTTSVRQLLASARHPFPRQRLSFELARELVDWGYRDDVAAYLDLTSRGRNDSWTLTRWAALIREGKTPDLIPYRTGCGKTPC